MCTHTHKDVQQQVQVATILPVTIVVITVYLGCIGIIFRIWYLAVIWCRWNSLGAQLVYFLTVLPTLPALFMFCSSFHLFSKFVYRHMITQKNTVLIPLWYKCRQDNTMYSHQPRQFVVHSEGLSFTLVTLFSHLKAAGICSICSQATISYDIHRTKVIFNCIWLLCGSLRCKF